MNPTISLVIANHNYGRFLPQCLDSVLKQTRVPHEIIVVDDGSTDDSRAVLNAYRGRVHAIFQENQGQAAALNHGVRASNGDLIFFLDSDDGWYPNKVERVLATMKAHPQAGWLRHKLAMVDEWLKPMGPVSPHYRGSRSVAPDPRLLLERRVTAGTSIVIRREAATQAFPLTTSRDFAFDADAILLARLFRARVPGYSLDQVLGYYRRHEGQRYVGPQDLGRLLHRELAVGDAIANVLGHEPRSSNAFKLRVVLAAMAGSRWWQPDRRNNLMRGLAASGQLWSRPALCARQTAALLFAYTAPRSWLEKLERTQAFASSSPTAHPH
ncbi:MAG: glycosyltransferase family 2 protein [Longimicrobiales bacterium]